MRESVSEDPEGVTLRLHVQPNARRTEFSGRHGDAVKLRLAAPPVDGKANDLLRRFLAECVGVPRASVRIISGESSRQKVIRIVGCTSERLRTVISERIG